MLLVMRQMLEEQRRMQQELQTQAANQRLLMQQLPQQLQQPQQPEQPQQPQQQPRQQLQQEPEERPQEPALNICQSMYIYKYIYLLYTYIYKSAILYLMYNYFQICLDIDEVRAELGLDIMPNGA